MTSNNSFIIAAYAVTWIMILGYTIRLFMKSSRAEADFARHSRDAETRS